jgi:hypothetical protein
MLSLKSLSSWSTKLFGKENGEINKEIRVLSVSEIESITNINEFVDQYNERLVFLMSKRNSDSSNEVFITSNDIDMQVLRLARVARRKITENKNWIGIEEKTLGNSQIEYIGTPLNQTWEDFIESFTAIGKKIIIEGDKITKNI